MIGPKYRSLLDDVTPGVDTVFTSHEFALLMFCKGDWEWMRWTTLCRNKRGSTEYWEFRRMLEDRQLWHNRIYPNDQIYAL